MKSLFVGFCFNLCLANITKFNPFNIADGFWEDLHDGH